MKKREREEKEKKIREVLMKRKPNQKLVFELDRLTDKQIEYIAEYSLRYSGTEVKKYLKINARIELEKKEKAEAFQKKYGKTVDKFQHILKEHRKTITTYITEQMADDKPIYMKNYKAKLKKKYDDESSWNPNAVRERFNLSKFNEMYAEKVASNIKSSIEINEAKLINAIYEYTGTLLVKKVKKVYSKFGMKGIEGRYTLTLEDGTVGDMTTCSINAGGYNIQCFHYRYIIKLDESLLDKQDDSLFFSDKELEVIKILTDNIKTFVEDTSRKGVMIIPSKIKYMVESLKGASRNWSPLVKNNVIYKSEFGNYVYKQYNYFIPKKSWELFKTLKGGQ